jgi:hypothetical protein
MFDQSIADDLIASMGALQGLEERLEISITIISVLVVTTRIAALVTGPRNGLFATVNVFIFLVFLGCCGFVVIDERHLTRLADAVLERVPHFSN